MLACDKPGNRLHGAGAVQRYDSSDILNRLGLQAQTHTGHAGGLHLEHTGGAALRQHLEDLRIIHRDLLQIEVRLILAHHLHSIRQHRQVPQAQKVHFQQAKLLQRDHVILADNGFVVASQRYILVHRQSGDDHAGGVGRGVAGHPLQRLGGVDEFFHPFIGLIEIGQLPGQPQRVIQRDMQRAGAGGHQLGHHIHLGIGHVQRTAHVTDGAPGRHGTEGDDLGHMVVTILAADILHHLAPAGIAEVHVDIRHGHTLRVQKTLKVQLVLHGVNVGNMQAVGHHGAGGAAAAGTDGDPRLPGIAHKVGHDEKIVRKAHLLDHGQLVFQLLPVIRLLVAVALGKSLVTQLAQIGGGIVAGRQLEFRQMVLAEGKFQLAAIRDALGILHSLRVAGEQGLHFLRRAEIEVPGLIAHAIFIVHGLAGLDAQQHVVALGILTAEVVGIVGAHQRDAGLIVHPQQGTVDGGLVRDAVILQLQIEIVLPQNVLQFQRIGLGPIVVAVQNAARDLTGKTRGQADQPLAVSAEQVKIDAGLDVKPLDIRL